MLEAVRGVADLALEIEGQRAGIRGRGGQGVDRLRRGVMASDRARGQRVWRDFRLAH